MRYDIIKTENYLLVVDDSEIKEDDWCLANGVTYNNTVVKYLKSPCPPPYVSNLSILKKIIAHLPLNSPILDGVDLLPQLEQQDDVEKLGIKDLESYYGSNLELTKLGEMWTDGFDIGYNQAKEKYKYTEEDIFKAYDCGSNALLGVSKQSLINFLSQPKYPIGFECEMEWYNPKTNQSAYSLPEITGLNDNDGCYTINTKAFITTYPCNYYSMKTKTTSNSQGQTILVGKYIYS
jgi:hypothetical protein